MNNPKENEGLPFPQGKTLFGSRTEYIQINYRSDRLGLSGGNYIPKITTQNEGERLRRCAEFWREVHARWLEDLLIPESPIEST